MYDGNGWGKEHFWNIINTNKKEFDAIDIPNGKTITLEYQMVAQKSATADTYGELSINSSNDSLKEKITTKLFLFIRLLKNMKLFIL